MNAAIEELAWSPRRWALTFLLVLGSQFGFVFWFSNSRAIVPAPARPRTPVRFFLTRHAESDQPWARDQMDPTLFALVTPEGFSGQAWLAPPLLAYDSSHPPQPLHWLAPVVEELADDFAEFVQTNLLSEDLVVDRLPPALAQPWVPTPVVVASTVLRLEGGLAGRHWLPIGPLPQSAEPLLTNTVVRVLVDGTGAPLSAALLSSSLAPKADQEALAFARAIRFEPTQNGASAGHSAPGMVTGDLVFQWARARWAEGNTITAKQ